MEQRNVAEQSFKAGRITLRERLEKSEPFYSIACSVCAGVYLMVRAAWDHDFPGVILFGVFFLAVFPLALWRYHGSRRSAKGASE